MTASAPPQAFDPVTLQRLLDGPYAELCQQVRDVLSRPEFAPVIALPTGEYRERVLAWAQHLAHEGLPRELVTFVAGQTVETVVERLIARSTGKGLFQEHGRLSSPRTKAITREVNRLCNEVRQQAGPIVDAFGIPDAVLAAPIGLREPPSPPEG